MAAGLALVTLAAYLNSFSVPFVFDDLPAIVENTSIRDLSAVSEVLAPGQGGLTTSGRPFLNLTFALNYALSGKGVWSYHSANLAIHLFAGLCLFGIVRRTLLAPARRERFGTAALPVAAASAGLWLLHPLQTESVTYIVQRAESLAGLLYLFTLYAFIRAIPGHPLNDKPPAPSPGKTGVGRLMLDQPRPGRGWFGWSVGACLLGMGTKEIMATAPLVVLLYDRTFVAGSFVGAWRRRRGFYVALASTWLLLAWLIVSTGHRGGTAGFGTDISSWSYALTQCRAIVRYLALSVWPHPLVFDYGVALERELVDVLPHALVVVLLLAAVAWALVRRPVTGFCGAWFLALLAPSSSFVPVATQTMAEHRMYLPLAAVIVVLVAMIGRLRFRGRTALLAVTLMAAGVFTHVRNRDYASEVAIWGDTVAKVPGNARAHNNLGQALFRAGQIERAIASYERAVQLQPNYPESHYNLGVAFARRGESAPAQRHYEAALRLQPAYPEAHNNLGNLLLALGRPEEARRHYEAALQLRPAFAEAHHNLGNLLLQSNRPAEALLQFQRAVALRPDYAEAHYNRGNALAASERLSDALAAYREALRIDPRYAEAHVNAGNALFQAGQLPEAIAHYEQALAIDPALADAQLNLGFALLAAERWSDAAGRFERLLGTAAAPARAQRGLGFALARLGRRAEAVRLYQEYLRREPNDTEARAELAEIQRG